MVVELNRQRSAEGKSARLVARDWFSQQGFIAKERWSLLSPKDKVQQHRQYDGGKYREENHKKATDGTAKGTDPHVGHLHHSADRRRMPARAVALAT
ncbi:MAG: hypothetical protein M3143_08060 [Actinomycetota bacterium]|nr:hypothetical protein [Actinomycetota bacterium]